MVRLMLLWLPILLSSAFVFVVSALIHMVLPWHKSDYRKLPEEDRVMDALRPFSISPGEYMMPMPASMKARSWSERLGQLCAQVRGWETAAPPS